ncbi:MAG: AAA family ATPase [Methanomassiliicoccales archaeon]
MSYRIAVAGKGGVGKTTLAALIIRALHERTGRIVMAVDADPNSNLGEMLGVRVERTLGQLREDFMRQIDSLPTGVSKQEYLGQQMRLAMVEGKGFDLLSMGRPEGRGCYCYINNMLRTLLDNAMDSYEYVVIDNEAGMEHLSRRTTSHMDLLLLVSDATTIGVRTASRLLGLAKEMELEVKSIALAINGIRGQIHSSVEETVQRVSTDATFMIPFSQQIYDISLEGKSVWDLSGSDPAFHAVRSMLDSVLRFINIGH